MRRLVDFWWLIGFTLLVAVIVLTSVLYTTDAGNRQQQQRTAEHQALLVLGSSVADVLAREVALARVVGTLTGPIGRRWPVLSSIVMSQPLAYSVGFIQAVSQRDRAAFQRRTRLALVESPTSGVLRVAGRRRLHLVLTQFEQTGRDPPPLGLDLAANPLRRKLLLEAAQTGRQLASMVTAHSPGAHLTIRDGVNTLTSSPGALTGHPAVIPVAGRRWRVWAEVASPGTSAVPWLVLSLGLVLTAAVMLILRQAATGARIVTRQLARRDAEEAAVGQIATLVAQGATPAAVFTSVGQQVAELFHSTTGAISRFDPQLNRGMIVGGWNDRGQPIAGAVFALDGATASATVFRSGHSARTDVYESGGDSGSESESGEPITGLLGRLGTRAGVAAPIMVAGELWGALGAAYDEQLIPDGVELRLERFASLVGLAIANADALDRLARQASTDPLTAIANRRAFHEHVSAEVARARRYGRDLSLVLIDLDHFKAVNDRYGHQAGDRVLVRFARHLSSHARKGELVARIGGEEFAWLMPETNQHGAYVAADRVRKAIEATLFEEVGAVTLSAGVCSTDGSRDPDRLFRDADRALYWAKESGRNMTFLYTDEAQASLGVAQGPTEVAAAPGPDRGALPNR